MEKQIKDYLHLYLGCSCVIETGGGRTTWAQKLTADALAHQRHIKPILRPLSSMTEAEAKIYFGLPENADVYLRIIQDGYTEFLYKWEDDEIVYTTTDGKAYSAVAITHNPNLLEILPEQFIWLLSKHFDLFGLIESGLAIDATTLKATQT